MADVASLANTAFRVPKSVTMTDTRRRTISSSIGEARFIDRPTNDIQWSRCDLQHSRFRRAPGGMQQRQLLMLLLMKHQVSRSPAFPFAGHGPRAATPPRRP